MGTDFQQKIAEYAKFDISIRTLNKDGNNYYIVKLTFGNKWKVIEPVNDTQHNVVFAKVEENGTYCYMTEFSNGINPIFEMIDETIRYNEELEKKVELLKSKAEELKNLFATHSYEELLRLKIVLDNETVSVEQKRKPATSSKKRTTPTQKKETVPTTSVIEKPIVEVADKKENTKPNVNDTISELDRKIEEAVKNKK